MHVACIFMRHLYFVPWVSSVRKGVKKSIKKCVKEKTKVYVFLSFRLVSHCVFRKNVFLVHRTHMEMKIHTTAQFVWNFSTACELDFLKSPLHCYCCNMLWVSHMSIYHKYKHELKNLNHELGATS